MVNEVSKESAFLVTNASGRHINLLNDSNTIIKHNVTTVPSPPSSEISDEITVLDIALNDTKQNNITTDVNTSTTTNIKRKYHCTEPGCTKSFTTSGHLARHNRIHTGEKNFPCLFPGCLSKFSRQDNMMQHYRTHMSPKSKRAPKRVVSEDLHPRPKLHAHQRIRSDPYQTERPLTIDQHLNNYRQSLLLSTNLNQNIRYNMPTPIGSVASDLQKQQQKNAHLPEEVTVPQKDTHKRQKINHNRQPSEVTFYQYKPLQYSRKASNPFPYTLLHPESLKKDNKPLFSSSNSISHPSTSSTNTISEDSNNSSPNSSSSNSSLPNSTSAQSGLLQLAHIVSTFG